MNQTYKAVLELVKSAVTGEKVTLPANTDWQAVVQIAKIHQIIPMIFYGLNNSGINTPYNQKLFDITAQNVLMEQEQLNAIKKIGDTFSTMGIDHAFLKGSRIKFLYPATELRVMGDLDILIKVEQYHKIKPIMTELGFVEGNEWDHEIHWEKGCVHLELHKSLTPSEDNCDRDISEFFGVGWNKFHLSDEAPCRYVMTAEDELVFLLAHLIKHYRFSGIGIRQFVDIYLYTKKNDINYHRLESELKKLGVLDFYKNCILTLDSWFENGAESEVTNIITKRVFTSGAYGTQDNNAVANAAVNLKKEGSLAKAKIKLFFHSVFLPFGEMKERYSVLAKLPFLLPVMWVVRWITILFNPEVVRTFLNRLKKYDKKIVSEFEKQLKKVGL